MMATYSKSSDIKLCQEIVDACNRVLESSKYFQNIWKDFVWKRKKSICVLRLQRA